MNNCQKIKMMDCETLADFLIKEFVDGCCDTCPVYSTICSNNPKYYSEPEYYSCQEQMVKWLQSEVSE